MFQQFADFLRDKYPSLTVEGDFFPPPHPRQVASQILGMVKIALIVLIISGMDPFPYLNTPTPSLFTWAINNKIYACMMLFFIGNAIEGQLISTGAFEITYNNVPVWSKMETGRIPSPQEMLQIVENHMRMTHQPASMG